MGRSDTDLVADSVTHQSVTGYHCNAHCVTMSMCNRSLKQSVSVHSKQSSTQPVIAQESLWTRRTCQGTVSRWIQIRHDSLQRRRPGGLMHLEIRCLALQQCTRENVYRWNEWTRKTILPISSRNIHERARKQSVTRKLALRILAATSGDD